MAISLPLIFYILFLVIACVLIWSGIRRVMKEPSNPTFTYRHTIDFFSGIADLIGIIGVIVTIISLSPLFLTFILGEGWDHILLTTQMGIMALGAIIIATYFSAFFIYCLLGLIAVRWIHEIGRNPEVRLSDKLISLLIVVSGVVTIGSLIWFLITAWFLSICAPMAITGVAILLLILGLAAIIVLSFFLDVSSIIQHKAIRLIATLVILILLAGVTAGLLSLATDGVGSIYGTASGYAVAEKFPFTFDADRVTTGPETPAVVLLRPDFSAYPEDDINRDFASCRWSANYGYFFTVDTGTLLAQKQPGEFVIDRCLQIPNTSIYWTYDIQDYDKNKPAVILSLQVENANKRHSFNNLGSPPDYVIGSAHTNITWSGRDEVVIRDTAVF